eukprot:GEMP01043626.1.p1 GENE.GEMP01043626.1~~GEMP01043626.1.p1  ORF type:complete len:395 (+),score=93.39 GEMP01043626.1:19-1203(+)
MVEWTREFQCEFQGCQSSTEELEELRKREGANYGGFPHDEDPTIRVCTRCRQIPLDSHRAASGLEKIFITSLQEELRALEATQEDLAPVFRYYHRYAKELVAMLHSTVQECFPWEIPPILELIDDLLLYERIEEIVTSLAITTWKKLDERHRKKLARMIGTWRELKVFLNPDLFNDLDAKIRALNLTPEVLDISQGEESDDEPTGAISADNPKGTTPAPPQMKRQKTDDDAAGASPKNVKMRTPKEVLERILKASTSDPFEVLDMDIKTASAKAVRKQYRRLCLYIHPDKNPSMDVEKCQDALTKVQKARDEAEARLEAPKVQRTGDLSASATMCATSEEKQTCQLDECGEPPCRQCANACCVRNITHCHKMQQRPGGKKCFFHPPPRRHARNA